MKKTILLVILSCAAFGFSACEEENGLQESQLIYFSITEPYTRIGGIACSINNATLEITNDEPIPADIDLSAVTPWFVTSHEGKGVFVKGVQQQSGVTRQNLTVPVVYEVVSDRGTLKYTVNLTQSPNVRTQAGVKLMALTDLVGGITAEREQWIDPGLRFSEVEFTAADDGRGLRMDLFEVDLSRSDLALYPLTPDNIDAAPAGGGWPVQPIPQQAAAAESAGIRVLGAVNGDFYDINASNEAEGPMCRDGKWIKETFLTETSNRYFGVRSDGRTSIGGYSTFISLQDKLTFAIGARQYLLQDDAPAEEIKGDQPRSHRVGIGTNAWDHQTVYIACIEGLSGSSAAVRMVELANVLKAFGASEAVNLDGGGSATFVIKEDGAFQAVNRPGGTLRPVVNGVAVIKR